MPVPETSSSADFEVESAMLDFWLDNWAYQELLQSMDAQVGE
jgi:hypothetical protein